MKEATVIDWADLDLFETIGEGSFGTVKRAKLRTRTGDKEVAVKMPKDDCRFGSTNPDFFHEADVLLSLPPDPNLPTVIGVCLEEENPAIIFELIDGWRLEEMLQGIGCMIPYVKFVLQCALQIVSALCVLHANGVVHRDVALRNVMITRELVCKLIDFGLSQYGDDRIRYSTRPNECIPLRWAPPESFNVRAASGTEQSGSDSAPIGVPFSTKTDCWAMGVLLWEMFTLSLPYGIFPTLEELRHRICDEGRRLERPPQCPLALYDRVMMPLLGADPNERPSMQAIKDELCCLLQELEMGSDLGGFGGEPSDALVDAMLLEKIYLVL